jgi:hypothetical protein
MRRGANSCAQLSVVLQSNDGMKAKDPNKLDRIVAEARRTAAKREQGYREQALRIYPWICGRCGRDSHAPIFVSSPFITATTITPQPARWL